MIVSNSGVNHAPVEAAIIAKQKKIKSIAITSVKYSKKAPLSDLNKRLYEIVDVYIDNKIPPVQKQQGVLYVRHSDHKDQ